MYLKFSLIIKFQKYKKTVLNTYKKSKLFFFISFQIEIIHTYSNNNQSRDVN